VVITPSEALRCAEELLQREYVRSRAPIRSPLAANGRRSHSPRLNLVKDAGETRAGVSLVLRQF
jgi:hypothetical protein